MAYTPASTLQAVEALYIGYFGRAGEPGGVSYWVNQINNGQTFAQAAAAFSVQAEAKAQHPFLANPGLVSPGDFVESLYQQLFGRASDAAGKAYWVAQLSAANGNPFAYGLLVAQFISGAQNSADGQDLTVIQNKVTAAEYFTGKLATAGIQGTDDKGQVTAAVDQAATDVLSGVTKETSSVTAANNKTDAFVSGAATGTTYTLKVDADNIPGTSANDVVNGAVSGTAASNTLTVLDSIDGAGGTDRINLTVDVGGAAKIGASTIAGATIKNIEQFYIRNIDTGNTATIDFGTIVGETQVWSDRSTVANIFNNLGTGTVVGVNGDGSVTNANTSFAYATATDAVSIAVANGTKAGAITNTANGATTATIASTGASNTVGTVTLSNSASIKTATIDATTGFKGALATGAFAADAVLTLKGAGAIELTTALAASIVNVDASANAGGSKVIITNAGTSFKGGAGADTVTINGTNFNGTGKLDGGAGTADILVINNDSAMTTAAKANISNFEILRVTDNADAAAEVIDASLFTGITGLQIDAIAAAGDAITFNNVSAAQAAAVTIRGNQAGAPTFNLTNATNPGTQDVLSVSINDGAAAKSTITLANLNAAGVETVNFSLTDSLTVSSATGLTALTKMTVTGAGDFAFTSGALAANVNSSIDASGATGTVNINVSAATANGFEIKTGSGTAFVVGSAQNDTIITGSGGAPFASGNLVSGGGGADTINLSASTGVADRVYVASTESQSTAFDKVTGFTNAAGTGDQFFSSNGGVNVGSNLSNAATGIAGVTANATDGLITFSGPNSGTATLTHI